MLIALCVVCCIIGSLYCLLYCLLIIIRLSIIYVKLKLINNPHNFCYLAHNVAGARRLAIFLGRVRVGITDLYRKQIRRRRGRLRDGIYSLHLDDLVRRVHGLDDGGAGGPAGVSRIVQEAVVVRVVPSEFVELILLQGRYPEKNATLEGGI